MFALFQPDITLFWEIIILFKEIYLDGESKGFFFRGEGARSTLVGFEDYSMQESGPPYVMPGLNLPSQLCEIPPCPHTVSVALLQSTHG